MRGSWKTSALIAVILLIAALGFVRMGGEYGNRRDADWYADYVKRNGAILAGIAGGAIDPERSAAAKALLRKGAVEQVYAGGGRTVFSLRTDIAEGHYMLVLVSGDDYSPRSLDGFGEWKIAENEDGFVRWEGGMAGRGYVELYRLGSGFYLEKAYLPT